ncbi:MAG: hypothetical protein HFE76_14135 [Firmicutes bacterium]|nr:hypothetical protein [Bacillota bacterium]
MIMIHNQAGTRMMPAWWGLKMEKCDDGYKLFTDMGHRELACYQDKRICRRVLRKCKRCTRSGKDYVMPKDRPG